MSKRWKVRKKNAAKREKSSEILDAFYRRVISELERAKATPSARLGDHNPDIPKD